jgi:predicted transcriptional regulator
MDYTFTYNAEAELQALALCTTLTLQDVRKVLAALQNGEGAEIACEVVMCSDALNCTAEEWAAAGQS